MPRTYWSAPTLDIRQSGFRTLWGAVLLGSDNRVIAASPDEANLICSRTERGTHMPVLDLDIPHRIVESSTPGHGHLYLDVEMSWPKYVLLLLVLRYTGVIERGHCYWSIRRRGTFVRTPWTRKVSQCETQVDECQTALA